MHALPIVYQAVHFSPLLSHFYSVATLCMMSSGIIVIIAAIAFVSASPNAIKRQSCPRPVPQQCVTEFTMIPRIFGGAISTPTIASKQQAIDQLRPLLGSFCTSNCLVPFAANLTCQGVQTVDILTFTQTGICGREGGEFCLIRVIRVNSSGIPLVPNCPTAGNSCDSSCRQSLVTLQTRLGCCAARLYNTAGNTVLPQFTRCGVNLGDRCAPATGAGTTTALCLSALLILAVSALAIVF